MPWAAVLVGLQFLAVASQGDSTPGEALNEVSHAAAGASNLNRRSGLVRTESHDHQSHHHRHHNIKGMFHILDRNKDGLVTADEIKAMMDNKHYHPKAVIELVNSLPADRAGFSLNDFESHAHKHARDRQEAMSFSEQQQFHEADVREHRTAGDQVTCGGHKAATCALCPTTDSSGNQVFDHGSEWCNGDCVWHELKCHLKGTVTVTVSGTSAGTASQYGTTPLPDIMNPNITDKDKGIIDKAAGAAIREENVEAAEKQRAEEEDAEAKKFGWGKFWLITIITISVCLGACACVTVIAVCLYYNMGTPTKEVQEDEGEEGEDAALAEAQGADAAVAES